MHIAHAVSYVFEAPVKDLKLLPGETGLRLKLLQAFRTMTYCRKLELIFNAVWRGNGRRSNTIKVLASLSRPNLEAAPLQYQITAPIYQTDGNICKTSKSEGRDFP